MFLRTFSPVAPVALAVAAFLSGCSGDDEGCVSTRSYFARDVWASFMGTQCFKCHSPDGVAVAQQNAKFVLQPSSYPAFLDANLASVREIAKVEYEGVSELLLKPLGKMNHGGGAVLTEDSAQYEALKNLVDRMKKPEACEEQVSGATLEGVEELDPQATFRKAALHLAGRLPTSAETQSIVQGGEAALEQALTGLLNEPAFYDRLQELFNDVLLTDRYAWKSYPIALNLLSGEDFPGALALRKEWDKGANGEWAAWSDDQKRHMNDVVGREPLNLIRWVVESDLPFTEILAADYTVVDDALARVYGVEDGKTGLRKAQIGIGAAKAPYPHAGILSTPVFLNRWPTTPTNRSRGRARILLKNFLATDILKIADRPVDVATVTAKDNPTMNAEQCNVCHRIIDPIAGGFRGWDESDYERFKADRAWHDDMVHPGYGATDLPPERYGSAISWLGQQMASDPRFDLATAQLVFKMVTGRGVLSYPIAGEPDFGAKLRAWEAQDAFVRAMLQGYKDGGRNLKLLFKAVVKSPYYRAIRIRGASAEHLVDADAFGTARLLSPEMLNRKLVATTGIHWRKPWDWKKPPQDWLLDSGIGALYGGIDSDSVVERAVALNGVMSNLAWRLANEVACSAVPYDLSLEQDKRALFPHVRLVEVPESAGYAVPGAQAKMKQNIQHLHERLLGERLADNDPEIEKTFQLFLETWREGQQGPNAKGLNWPCSQSPVDGEDLPEEIRRDRGYVVRSWMAVVTYLLGDSRFLYE